MVFLLVSDCPHGLSRRYRQTGRQMSSRMSSEAHPASNVEDAVTGFPQRRSPEPETMLNKSTGVDKFNVGARWIYPLKLFRRRGTEGYSSLSIIMRWHERAPRRASRLSALPASSSSNLAEGNCARFRSGTTMLPSSQRLRATPRAPSRSGTAAQMPTTPPRVASRRAGCDACVVRNTPRRHKT